MQKKIEATEQRPSMVKKTRKRLWLDAVLQVAKVGSSLFGLIDRALDLWSKFSDFF